MLIKRDVKKNSCQSENRVRYNTPEVAWLQLQKVLCSPFKNTTFSLWCSWTSLLSAPKLQEIIVFLLLSCARFCLKPPFCLDFLFFSSQLSSCHSSPQASPSFIHPFTQFLFISLFLFSLFSKSTNCCCLYLLSNVYTCAVDKKANICIIVEQVEFHHFLSHQQCKDLQSQSSFPNQRCYLSIFCHL